MKAQKSLKTTLALAELFEGFTDTQLDMVAAICERETYDAGHTLFREYEGTDDVYVIGRGGVEILMNPGVVGTSDADRALQPVILTELRQGQLLGEIALVDQGLRSATARVSQDGTELLRMPRQKLMMLSDSYTDLGYKLMKNLAADLAMKIRHTDLTVRQYQLMLSRADRRADQSA